MDKRKKTGRPLAEFDAKQFSDLISIGCGADEICWFFRDEKGKPANIDTLSRWCKREFGMTFQEYRVSYGKMALKIKIRQNQLKLSEKSATMAIFLGKNLLGQSDRVIVDNPGQKSVVESIARLLMENKSGDIVVDSGDSNE